MKENISNNKENDLFFKVCFQCNLEKIYYTTLNGFKYGIKHNTICKSCKNKNKSNTIYKRNCPKCGKELITKNKYWNELAVKENRVCCVCSGKSFVFTKKWKENMKKNHADFSGEKNPFYGKTHTPEVIEKLRSVNLGKDRFSKKYKRLLKKKMVGEGNYFYGKTHTPEVIEKLRNISDDVRVLRRTNRLKQIEESGGIPSFNKDACKYFDKLNEKRKWNLQHALNGGEVVLCGYSVDAYDKNKNLVVEYDESYHNQPKRKEKDIKRQEEIIKTLHCKFYRYNEVLNKLYEVTLLNETNNKN